METNPVIEYNFKTRCEGTKEEYHALTLIHKSGFKKVHTSKNRNYLKKFLPSWAKVSQ